MTGTRCYFCHDVLRNETAEQHAAHCGYVLEPCSNRCGAYIPRNKRRQHYEVCRNARLKSAKSTESLLSAAGCDTYPRSSQSTTAFARTGTLPRSYRPQDSQTPQRLNNQYPNHYHSQMLGPQTPQNARYNMASPDLGCSNQQYDRLKENFQRGHQQQTEQLRQVEFTINKLRADVQMMQTQNKTLVEWRTNVQYQLDGIVGEFRTLNSNNKNEINTHRLQEITKDLTQLRTTLNSQQLTLKNCQVEVEQFRNEIEFRLKELEKYVGTEVQKLAMSNTEQTLKIETLTKNSLSDKTANEELKIEINGLHNEVKSLRTQCTNMAEINKSQGAQINDLKSAIAKVNLNVEVTEQSFENIQGLIATQPGRLVWKISDFDIKMQNAKGNEKIPLKSPIFYTGDYGYRVRLLVHLNGLKKWRGRHLLAGLHVMKGDYDDLLKWPCKIEANVILRDLEVSGKAKDYTRYVTAKRNSPEDIADDPQESSTEYLFIPHTTLLKPNYVKNNAIFLEIVINTSK